MVVIEQPALSDAEIRKELVRRSIAHMPARVHALTTWIAAGGTAVAEAPTVGQAAAPPICYDSDVTQDMVESFGSQK